MQVDPTPSSSSSSSTSYGGWFPSSHATSRAFDSPGNPQQPTAGHPPQPFVQHAPQGPFSLKRTRSNDNSLPEPSPKRPLIASHISAPFLSSAIPESQTALLFAAEHLRLNSPRTTPTPRTSPPLTASEDPELARMEAMGAGVSFMGFAAHEMYQEPPRRASNAMADDGMVIDSEPVTWGSSKSTHFQQPQQSFPPAQSHQLPLGFPSQTPASTPHHSPHLAFASLPNSGPVSPLSHTSSYNYGSPRPLQPPSSGKPVGYSMGPRADCEKCRLGVSGHYGHINGGR